MLYTDLESLALAATQTDLTDDVQVSRLRDLLRVYFDALHNAPAGIIGVGAITFAQDSLVAHQLNGKG